MNLDRVPIFPLPNTVLFPHTHLPLHVFEPRYRELTVDAISGDGFLGVALLAPGWEDDYYGAPDVHRVAGVGFIEKHERLDDGRYNILVKGLHRVEILEELVGDRYRYVRTRPLEDVFPAGGAASLDDGAATLRSCCLRLLSHVNEPNAAALARKLQTMADPGALTDSVSALFVQDPTERQTLMETLEVAIRLEHVTELLASMLLRVESAAADPDDPLN